MGEHNQAGNDAANANSGNDYRGRLGDLYWVVSTANIAFVCLLLAALFWPNLTERTKFFTANLFNLMVAFAVIAQVIIYRKQWGVMERQIKLMALSECAYIMAENFQQPIVGNNAVTIQGKFFNRGRTPAFALERKIQIGIGKGYPLEDWGRIDWEGNPFNAEPTLIPANSDINFGMTVRDVSDAEIAGIEKGDLLISVDGECRYFDNLGDQQIYIFGVTFELNPVRPYIRYHQHRREKSKPD